MIKTDLHAHGLDHYDITVNRAIPLLGGKNYNGIPSPSELFQGTSLPERLLETSFSKALHSLVCLANFDDERAERMINQLRRLAEEKGYTVRDNTSFISIDREDQTASYIRGQELETDGGHILFVGAEKNIKSANLEETIRKAKKEYNALVLVPHSLVGNSTLMRKVIGHNRTSGERPQIKQVSLGIQELEKFKEYIDGIEIQKGKYEMAQLEVAQKLNLPTYAASGSHRPQNILNAGVEFDTLDFSNLDNLRESIRISLRGNPRKFFTSPNPVEDFRHKASVALAI